MGVNGIYGLSGSGLDVESMVKVGMMSKKNEYEKMQQKFTQNEWKKAEYLELYGEVQTFNNSTLSQYKLSSNMNARSAASSNESAVTATATANAAPMQHYVEVGQLATAAYLIGTESVERVGEESDSNSTALVDSLFKSLTKNLNGTYTYSDTSLAKVAGLQADDIAFTFKIGDGTGTSNYTISSDENIFTARAYDSNGNSLAITENTKIDSHEVLLENFPTAAENVTSLSLDGIDDIANASMRDVFQKIFEIDDATEYNNRFNPLATNHGNDTAFTITFADGTTHTDGTASTTSVNFTYGDLVDGSNSFYAKIKNAVDNATKDISNISATTVGGSIIFSNAKIGADNKIDISVNFASDTFIGNTGYTASIYPEVISEENSVLKSDVPAKASDVFKTLLAIDEYGGTTTATEYLKNYKDSYDIALSIQFTNTKNGVPKTGTADITFAQMASDDNFSDVIIHSLNAAGFDTDGGDADFTISVDATNGKLKITNSNYGDNNAIEFSINPVGIGDADHPYPTAIPETKIIPNQTIAQWFDDINGEAVDFNAYMERLIELRRDGIANNKALTLKLDDGQGGTKDIDFTYEDLADQTKTLADKLSTTLTPAGTRNWTVGNIKIDYDADTRQIKFNNNTLGDYSKISVTLDIPSNSKVFGTTLETNGKISFASNISDNTTLKTFFNSVIDTEFTSEDKEAWATDTATAFKLAFQTADGSFTTNAVNISYSDLVNDTTTLKSILTTAVNDSNDPGKKFDIRTENDANGSNPHFVIFNTETGTSSSIQAVISEVSMGVSMGTGSHLAGKATTHSAVTANTTTLNNAIANKITNYGTIVTPYTNSATAITVKFSDGTNTNNVNINWGDIINQNTTTIVSALNTNPSNTEITYSNNQFKNGRISPPHTIEITTSAGTSSASVSYKATIKTNTPISTATTPEPITKTQFQAATSTTTTIFDKAEAITKNQFEQTTPITKTQFQAATSTTPTKVTTPKQSISISSTTPTQISWTPVITPNGDGTSTTTYSFATASGQIFTSTTAGTAYYYSVDGGNTYKTAGNDNAIYYYQLGDQIIDAGTTDPSTLYEFIDDSGNYTAVAQQVYSYMDANTSKVVNTTQEMYAYDLNGQKVYGNNNNAVYIYPTSEKNSDGSDKMTTSTSFLYYANVNGTIETSTTLKYTYTLNGTTKVADNNKQLYKYTLNGQEVETANQYYHQYTNGEVKTSDTQIWAYELNGQNFTADNNDTLYYYPNPSDNGATFTTSTDQVYYHKNLDGTVTTSTSTTPMYYYDLNGVTQHFNNSNAIYVYPTNQKNSDGSYQQTYSTNQVYYHQYNNGEVRTWGTNERWAYELNNNRNFDVDNNTQLYKYTLNGTDYTTDTNTPPIYIYEWNGTQHVSEAPVYKYIDNSGNEQTSTSTNYAYYYSDDGGSSTKYTTDSNLSVTGTATINVADVQSFLNLGTTTYNRTNTDTAKAAAQTALENLFSNTSTGTTKEFTPTYEIYNPGTSEDLNARLVENINNFLGTSPQNGDGGYTPSEYATKLLNFFGGGTTEIKKDDANLTYSITQSGKNGVAYIDGVAQELTKDRPNIVEVETTINGETGSVLYYFKPDAEGQSGVAFSKNDVQEISVTYEQLANGYSFNDLVSDINNLGLNIRATYDSVQDRFSIYNKKSGSENEIRIGFDNLINIKALEYELTDTTNLTGDELTAAQTKNAAINESIAAAKAKNAATERTIQFFNDIGLKQTENGVLSDDYTLAVGKTSVLAGKDAVAKIDGVDYYGLDSNSVTVNGVNYTFNAVTNAIDENDSSTYDTITKDGKEIKVVKSDSSTPKVTVNITQDTSAIAEKVKSFVEDYNAILAKLYEWYDEKPNENYKPLTTSQKEGMKDEQIEKWEEKAKAGLLYHDQTLYKVISDIRSSITEKVQGIDSDYDTIFSIGISTTGTKGQLKLDETKLNAALAADPDAVYNIFAKLDGGETQYLVEVNGTGTEIWSADPTYGRAVLDDEGNQQTKVENGVTLYLVEVKRKQIWTTNTSLGTVVTDSDGNPMTKTDDRYAYNGIANRLGNVLTNGMKNLRTVAGSSSSIDEDSDLNNLLRELQTKMSNFKRLMDAFESKLYKKYDAMESSLALLGAQLNYVTGAFQ